LTIVRLHLHEQQMLVAASETSPWRSPLDRRSVRPLTGANENCGTGLSMSAEGILRGSRFECPAEDNDQGNENREQQKAKDSACEEPGARPVPTSTGVVSSLRSWRRAIHSIAKIVGAAPFFVKA
jgi:hypothetical protein